MPVREAQARERENARLFKETCELMGAKYTEEEGLLESDVGGDHASDWMARKQWCDVGDVQVFRAPGVVHFHMPHVSLLDDIKFEMKGFYKEEYQKDRPTMFVPEKGIENTGKMCFHSYLPLLFDNEKEYARLPGVVAVCVDATKQVSFPAWHKQHYERLP